MVAGKTDQKPTFSILMATYNDVSLLDNAILSLEEQKFDAWELLVIDNSDVDMEPWKKLIEWGKKDRRIRAFKSPGISGNRNVGWPKSASLLLHEAKGEYITFLAADDRLNVGGLKRVAEVAEQENPDVIWVGNETYGIRQEGYLKLDEKIPAYNVYGSSNRSDAVYDIMTTVYYNSMFHYTKRQFLQDNGIDFFSPYYGDCASMTAVLCRAEKMITLDQPVHMLTLNTTQTAGKYTWGFYKVFASQWREVKRVFVHEDYEDAKKIRAVAEEIFVNFASNFYILMNPERTCRDMYMNPMKVDMKGRCGEVKEMLCNNELVDLLDILGKDELLAAMKGIALAAEGL